MVALGFGLFLKASEVQGFGFRGFGVVCLCCKYLTLFLVAFRAATPGSGGQHLTAKVSHIWTSRATRQCSWWIPPSCSERRFAPRLLSSGKYLTSTCLVIVLLHKNRLGSSTCPTLQTPHNRAQYSRSSPRSRKTHFPTP